MKSENKFRFILSILWKVGDMTELVLIGVGYALYCALDHIRVALEYIAEMYEQEDDVRIESTPVKIDYEEGIK